MSPISPTQQLTVRSLTWLLLGSDTAAGAHSLLRYRFKGKHKRERALLCGASVGSDAPGIAVPLVEALAGPAGVVAAASALVANTVAGDMLSTTAFTMQLVQSGIQLKQCSPLPLNSTF